MKAYELIDRLASLDEASTVEEPVVEPETIPGQEPALPTRRPSRDPFSVPPDFEPGQMPRPKAQDESGQISSWLSATEQPIQDWEWNGRELRMLMDDGSTEVYNRVQLEQSGVFDDSAAFAEAMEDLADEGNGGGESLYPGMEGPDQETVQAAIADEQPSNEAAGVLDQILGRTSPSGGCAGGEPGMGASEVIPIEGEQADNLVQAVSDLVSAIIGVAGGGGGEAPDMDKSEDKEDDKSDDKKSDKPKKAKKKSDDKKEDKEPSEKDDEKDDDEE